MAQNQRLSGLNSRQFARLWATSPKNPVKTARKVLENGAKWRFFGGLERHFAAPEADVAKSRPASLPDLTSCDVWLRPPAPARGIGGRAPFFHGRGHGLTWVNDPAGWALGLALTSPSAVRIGNGRRTSRHGQEDVMVGAIRWSATSRERTYYPNYLYYNIRRLTDFVNAPTRF
jgi:hypothetical protein